MRLLFVLAHPLPDSFCAALARAGVEAARARGHEVRLIDLQAEGFDPVMGPEERRGQDTDGPVPADLAPHVQALRWAEGVIFVYPTWWAAQPALLKGWFDRVWRPGVAFTLQGARLRPALTEMRLIGVVTTFGSPWWHWTLFMGAPGRKILLRGLRPCIAPKSRSFWLGLHGITASDEAKRQRFLDRVRARIAAIPL
jgi:NAD(P)H dehydrogenase (quinone)